MSHQRPDPEFEQRRAADPRASVWVAASAGTGKTKVLTDRVVNLLLVGTPPHKILCLTFTKAAAAEMANRIAQRLAGWATTPDAELLAELDRLGHPDPDPALLARARRLFAELLDTPGGMKIETIHAFCQSLLRRFPLEAGLAPHFRVMDERDAAELLAAAQEEVLAAARAAADPALAAALAEVTAHVHEAGFPELLAELARERGRLRRMIAAHGGLDRLIAAVRARLGLGSDETPAGILAAACDDTAFDLDACRRAVAILGDGTPSDGERAARIAAWLADPAQRVAAFWAYLESYFTRKLEIRSKLASKACGGAEAALRAEAERLAGVIERWRAASVAAATGALLRLGEALLSAYERNKGGRALLDYDDLILAAGRLLADGAGWVLFKLDGGIDHVLIDEAQDTNPEQWAVVRGITDEFFAGRGARPQLRTVFAVGDGKQSIYSFQGADPRAFEAMRGRYQAGVPAAGQRWEEVALRISFRSTAAVLDIVDAVFNRDPGRDGVALAGEEIRHVPFRAGQAGLVELWPPVKPRAVDEPAPWKPPIERTRGDSPRTRLARLVARRIEAMIGRERLESRGRPVRAGDIMVLVRRRNAFVEDLIRELRILRVAVAGADRLVLAEQMAVMDLVALGNAMLLPEDDLTLATVLKGPLVGMSEEALFQLAWGRGERPLWDELRRRSDEFAEAHAVLARLLALADRVPPHDFFAHVLIVEGGRRKLVERLGWEAEDAIDEFIGLTLAFEQTHPPSLQGFLRWLEAGAVEVRRDLEQGGHDAVRIMTVHGAKGLQAPVVFLPDTLQAPVQTPRLLWLGRRGEDMVLWPPRAELAEAACRDARAAAQRARDQEYRRLLYVALTRAEDRLYVCGWETRRSASADCWYHLVGAAMAEIAVQVDDPFLAAQAEPDPGAATVWRLSCRQTELPRAPAVAATLTPPPPLPAWAGQPPPPEPSPPRPLVPSRPEDAEPPVRAPFGADDGARFRRGLLIHRLLQTLPELDRAERARAAARFLARPAFGLGLGERAALAAEVAAVLEHPEFAPLFGPGSQAEVPVVGLIGDRAVSGQVDRLVVTADAVLVVDYKTNRPPPRDEAAVPTFYLRQMAAYRAALACIYPGRRIRCALLWTDGPRLMPLDGGRLDDLLARLGPLTTPEGGTMC